MTYDEQVLDKMRSLTQNAQHVAFNFFYYACGKMWATDTKTLIGMEMVGVEDNIYDTSLSLIGKNGIGFGETRQSIAWPSSHIKDFAESKMSISFLTSKEELLQGVEEVNENALHVPSLDMLSPKLPPEKPIKMVDSSIFYAAIDTAPSEQHISVGIKGSIVRIHWMFEGRHYIYVFVGKQ